MVIGAIVADDLTGACDSAVQFWKAGWEVALLLDDRRSGSPIPAGDGDTLLALTTDSRGLEDEAAEHATIRAVEAAQRLGATRLFLKIDSTMRGSVRAQVSGALLAWRRRWPGAIAVVCPAYPRMSRSVAAGVLLVDGVPVARSSMRHDPVSPPAASELRSLLPGSVALAGAGALAEALGHTSLAGGVVTADAGTDEDLRELAEAIALHPEVTLPVGSAGLAAAMARTWRPTSTRARGDLAALPVPTTPRPGVLVQVSSLNEVSRQQLAILEQEYAGRHLHLAPDLPTLSDPTALRRWFSDQPADHDEYDLVVVSAPVERSAKPDSGRRVAESLGAVTARVLRSRPFGVAGFVGGDGARSALAQLGVTALRIHGEIEEGIPLSTPIDGEAAGTLLFTKAGGFGGPGTLASVVAQLTATGPRRTNV